jgi:hypothetical protein
MLVAVVMERRDGHCRRLGPSEKYQVHGMDMTTALAVLARRWIEPTLSATRLAPAGSWQTQTICIISADPGFRDSFRAALPSANVVSPGGEDIVAWVARCGAGVILYDVVHADEWEEVSRLRSAPETHEIPLLVLAGCLWADGRSRRRARELSCAAVLSKPCRLDVLIDALQRVAG